MQQIRDHILAIAATTVGLLVIVVAVWGGVGWPSVALELGAGVFLVVVVLWLEMRLGEQVSREIQRVEKGVRHELDAMEERIDAAVEHAIDGVAREDDAIIDGFIKSPSPLTFWSLVERCKDLNIGDVKGVKVTDVCHIVFRGVDRNDIQVTIAQYKTGGVARHPQARFSWTSGMTYDDFSRRLLDEWGPTGMYPGNEAWREIDLIGDLAEQYRVDIDSVYNTVRRMGTQ